MKCLCVSVGLKKQHEKRQNLLFGQLRIYASGVLEQQNLKSEVDSWQAGLRGGEEAAEKDPLVFSNPSDFGRKMRNFCFVSH